MEEFLQIFGDITLSTAVTFIVALIFFATVGVKLYKIIVENHDTFQEKEALFEKLQKEVREIKENPTIGIQDLRELKDRQNNLENILNKILEEQKNIQIKQKAFEEEARLHNLNRLRDRLLQSYRYYTSIEKNPLKAWSEMEQEAFNKLFEDYESLGGNGFMHTVVAPAMASLEVIRMDNKNEIEGLMRSRKG